MPTKPARNYPVPSGMKTQALLDFRALDDILLPAAQEFSELDAYDDYMADVPAFRDAIAEAMYHNSIDDDMRPSIYGA